MYEKVVLLLVIVVVVGGCMGGGGFQGNGEATDSSGNGSPGDGKTDGSDNVQTYEMTEGETYEFNFSSPQGSGTMAFQVNSIDVGVVNTSVIVKPNGREKLSSYARGTRNTVIGKSVINSRLGDFLAFVRIPAKASEGRQLTEGNSWTMNASDVEVGDFSARVQNITVEVTGTDTVAGMDCTTVEISSEENPQVQNACVRNDMAFALRNSVETEEGEITVRLLDHSGGS